MAEIERRVQQRPAGSYTTKLLDGGVGAIGAKVREEAEEVVEAAQQLEDGTTDDPHHLIYEACDVIYHLWVLLGSRGVQVNDLRLELARREGVSGLEEKRLRGSDQK